MRAGRRLLHACLVASLGMSAAAVQAEDLLSLYRNAVSDFPALRARVLAIGRARSDADQAQSKLYPQISLQTSASRNDYRDALTESRFNGNRTIFIARQALLDLPSEHKLKGAKAVITQAEREAEQARTELFGQLADQYLLALQAEDELIQLQVEKEAADQQVERLRAMREREMAKITDLAEAISWREQLVTREIDAVNKAEAARTRLQEFTGRATGILSTMMMREFPAVPESAKYWVEGAMASNAAIAARQAAVESAREAVNAARADHYPQVALAFQRNQSNQDIDNSPRRDFTTDSIFLEMRLPIYEGGRVNAATASALALLAIANEQLDAARREVERDVRILYASATANRARIDSTNGEVEALNYTVRAQERGYELGVVTVIQVLDARRRLLRSRVDQAKARYDYLRDLIGLRMRAGGLSESDVIEFNRWLVPRSESVSMSDRTDWADVLLEKPRW